MKILQVVPFFTPARGGTVTSSYNISKHLAKRGHEVTIITTDFEFDDDYAKSLKRVEVIPFKCIINIGLFLITPSMKRWLKRNIKDYDVIHMNNFRPYQNIVVHHYAKKYGIPYILQARGSIPRFKQKEKLKETFDIFFGYRILKDASKLIFSTKMELKKCEKDFNIGKNKIEIVPNGIDLSEYGNLPEKGEFRRKYSIRADEKMILYVGRIHEIKGLDMLVRAFIDLVKELDNVKLIIVGPDDGYTSALKGIVTGLKINDKVLFTGPIFEKDKLEAYAGADVCVLPSKYESFGNVALEACACGTPVIVTDRCGVSEWVNSNVGYVVKYDKDQLRDALLKILSDEGLRMRFGEEGRKLAMNECGWDKIVLDIERIYGGVILK